MSRLKLRLVLKNMPVSGGCGRRVSEVHITAAAAIETPQLLRSLMSSSLPLLSSQALDLNHLPTENERKERWWRPRPSIKILKRSARVLTAEHLFYHFHKHYYYTLVLVTIKGTRVNFSCTVLHQNPDLPEIPDLPT